MKKVIFQEGNKMGISQEGNEEEPEQANTPATPPRKKRSKGHTKKKGVQRTLFSVEGDDEK